MIVWVVQIEAATHARETVQGRMFAGAAVAMVVGAVSAVIIHVLMALAGMRADAAATPKTV
jgi:hypothetical protein